MTLAAPSAPSGRHPLLLAPSGPRGWFGGRGLRAADPADIVTGVTLAEAATALQAAFEAHTPVLVAALVTYEGEATVLSYERWEPLPAVAVTLATAAPAGPPAALAAPAASLIADASLTLSGRAYRAAVREVRERIAAGDVYVLNLTYTLSGDAVLGAPALFDALCARGGAEMSAYLEVPGQRIASVSPERFVRVAREGGVRVAEVWPIKGTRPRGADPHTDAALAAALAADAKERAEHVMVVDLERNDIGRVCEAGSVAVSPLMEVVPTPYCHQMVSRVFGAMRPDASFAELFDAAFPCGSVTGAPKLAAMRIARELERGARGAYTGVLVVARPGELDSSVLIRTAVCEGPSGAPRGIAPGRVSWGTGCGITHESDPAEEWLETLLKASPLTGDGWPPVALRETCRVAGGRVPLLAYHLARLSAGGCGPSALALVRAEAARTLSEADPEPRFARLAITVGATGTVSAELSPAPSSLEVPGGPLLVAVEVVEAPVLPPGAAKPADRRVWDAAQRQAGSGAQAVLTGPDGAIIDGATASVWMRRGRDLFTPPAPPAVAGVAREAVFDVAAASGFTANEASITRADLAAADEVFFTNALAGVVSARRRGGEAARALGMALEREFGYPRPGCAEPAGSG